MDNRLLNADAWELDEASSHSYSIHDAYDLEFAEDTKEDTTDYYTKLHGLYSSDIPLFCKDNLVIVPEEAENSLIPLVLNYTQLKTHYLLETQLLTQGKIRMLILKPRREGISTYIEARFFNKTIYNMAMKTFILCNKQDATDTLFKMVMTFYDNLRPEFKPVTRQSNAKTLSFAKLNSDYSLGTANTDDVGRSKMAHLFHGSEVAFWKNAEDVYGSASEIVGEKKGTEIILESTGRHGTYFHELWDKTVANPNGGYGTIFHAWYDSPRNVADASNLIPTDDELELLKTYPRMTRENLAFRRAKMDTKSESWFNQEYPSCPSDAFQIDPKESFIHPTIVQMAVNRIVEPEFNDEKILGIDPSVKSDGDPCGAVFRHGCKVARVMEFRAYRIQDKADKIRKLIAELNPDKIFIDQGGSGKEIADLLKDWGINKIFVIPFKARADNPKLYVNKRNEMYSRMKHWLAEEGSIPHIEAFMAEISLTRTVTNNDGAIVLESKKDMSRSPNLADAFALTFASKGKSKNPRLGSYSYSLTGNNNEETKYR